MRVNSFARGFICQSMIRKSGYRFSEKIMLKQKDRAAALRSASGARQRLRRKLAARPGPSFSDILDPFRYSPPRTLR
jgi:hypothetical protein